jgi:hypothetical protein
MNKRAFNIAYVSAELKAKLCITKFEKEFEKNGNQNQQGQSTPQLRQDNAPQGNIPQQPGYGG